MSKKGIYASSKNDKIYKYRSSWELAYMRYLDDHPDVKKWDYECIAIPYISNKKTGKTRKYYPDFYVELGNKICVIEIKPSKRLTQLKNKKKIDAAKIFCQAKSWEFIILTENDLKNMHLILHLAATV